jgi:nitrogen fixation/metabolism regulation signal transduction histidine kinase
LTETDLRSIAEQALAFVMVPRNARVSNLTNTQPEIAVDVTEMPRVFVNLVKNAVDARRSKPRQAKSPVGGIFSDFVDLFSDVLGIVADDFLVRLRWFIT